MFAPVINFMLLPKDVSEFEDAYLKKMNRIAMLFFALHLPFYCLLAYLNHTGIGLAFILTTLGLVGPWIAMKTFESRRAVSFVMGLTMMFMCGLLIHFGQGPVQIEMHFYFFIGIAMLSIFGNPLVIVGATIGTALHHILLFIVLPSSVFNYEASVLVLLTHIVFALAAAAGASLLARTFFDNVIGLEKKVEERTQALASRNRDMRMILNSVEQGFLTIGRDGIIKDERSASVDKMLGKVERGQNLVEIFSRTNAKAADWLAFGLEEVFDGLLPPEVAVDQLPKELKVDSRNYAINYYPIEIAGEVNNMTVVITDVTAEVERKKLEVESRELITMVDRIAKDRSGFIKFFDEASFIIEQLRDRDEEGMVANKRNLHTLKGNAAVFGLNQLSEACHALEDAIEESITDTIEVKWTQLFGCWARIKGNLRRIIGDDSNLLRLSEDQYEQLLIGLLTRKPVEKLAPKVANWKLDPTQLRLETIGNQAKRLAKSLGKGDIEVVIESNGLHTESEIWSEFWGVLVHVVRNAVDHGLETLEERKKANKSAPAMLRFKTSFEGEQFVITVADNGKGIDWSRIKQLARSKDMPHQTQNDLTRALFADGLSTRDDVSQTSGRGVGMAAVLTSCERLNGKINIETEAGVGTEFQFIFPANCMAPETQELFEEYGFNSDVHTIVES